MSEQELIGWHFASADLRLGHGDEREIRVGETLTVEPPIELCERGLHASVRPLDALNYASGPIACRVRLSGLLIAGEDKAVATERTVLGMVDGERVFSAFIRYTLAYRQPYLVKLFERAGRIDHARLIEQLDMASAPYGDIKDTMAAARDAAWDDARDDARDAARAASWDTAWAAGDAARAAGLAARAAGTDAYSTAWATAGLAAAWAALNAELERLLVASMATEGVPA